ncbi:hypothetical protein K435DRAFT_718001 [Dendrothele bispora CBS 962.96]|uniref:Protein-S-isoprenylcysteine O-methyltransferase n=1 Tax=Dendrothele bispora (strain CBS 962.96) TaxID=1314807 RepID=A0A4S8MFY3_DENBC|nr:hypothetical protein K435DRAFT_718001 [Dendrothele bispora CBS 962.96]
MRYTAGIHLSHTQGVEAIVAGSTLVSFGVVIARQRQVWVKSDVQGGKIISLPASTLGRLVTPFHAIILVAVPLSYLAAVLSNGLEQPQWYQETGLGQEADLAVGIGGKAMIRTLASLGVLASTWFHDVTVRALDKQLHYIGVREKASVVSTGPYAYVRHPIYTFALSQMTLFSASFWSWIPLVGTAVVLPAFLYKIPLEEKLLEADPKLGPAYVEYKKSVPYRLIPYVW